MYHMRVAIETSTNQQIEQARSQFTEKIQGIEASAQSQMLNRLCPGIGAQEKQQLTELTKAYSDFYGDDQSKWQGYQDAKLQIEQNSDRERQQYSQQVNEQISQTEAQAARLILQPWQAAQQQIGDEYAQRLQKIRTDVQQHVVTEQQGAQQASAAWALANAQMQHQAEQSRDQIAGRLGSCSAIPQSTCRTAPSR